MRTIGELVSERTGKKKGGKRERERELRCITLNLPEYLPSEPSLRRCVSAHQCTWHPSEFSLLSFSLLTSSSSRLSFIPVHLSLSLSLARSNLARPFSPLPFLFLLRLLLEVNPPISYALHRYTGCRGNIQGDIDSSAGRRDFRCNIRRSRCVIDGSLLSGTEGRRNSARISRDYNILIETEILFRMDRSFFLLEKFFPSHRNSIVFDKNCAKKKKKKNDLYDLRKKLRRNKTNK